LECAPRRVLLAFDRVPEVTAHAMEIKQPHSPEDLLNEYSAVELMQYDAEVNSFVAERTRRRPALKATFEGSRPPSFASQSTTHSDYSRAKSASLMALGRQELLMREAEVNKKIVVRANNKDRVGLTSVELSHLHQQLQGITTTCTLVIGFAMAALSADLLGAMGDDFSLFCIYKSVASAILSGAFIMLTMTCICACFTIIACVQIIIFQSQRALFSRTMTHRLDDVAGKHINLTARVVRMTQLLIYGDRAALWDDASGARRGNSERKPRSVRQQQRAQKRLERQATRRAKASQTLAIGGFTIYIGLAVALSCFFLSTIILIWIFLSPLASWRNVSVDHSHNASLYAARENSRLVESTRGQWKTRCLDPENDDDAQYMVYVGTAISSASTLVFIGNVLLGYRVASRTMSRYTLPALLALGDDDEPEGRYSENGNQGFEDYHDDGEVPAHWRTGQDRVSTISFRGSHGGGLGGLSA